MEKRLSTFILQTKYISTKRKGNQKSNKNNNKFTLKCLSIHFLLNQYWDDKPRIVTTSCYWFITIQKHMTTVILLQHCMGITNNI